LAFGSDAGPDDDMAAAEEVVVLVGVVDDLAALFTGE
jgi:hypothetical protein